MLYMHTNAQTHTSMLKLLCLAITLCLAVMLSVGQSTCPGASDIKAVSWMFDTVNFT